MPRTGRHQPAVPYPGGQYGAGVDAVQAQHVIPLADERTPSPGAAPPPGPMPPVGQDEIVRRATATPPPAPMGGAGRPLTHGLSTGPGAGPEILGPVAQTGTGRLLRMMAEVTGDQSFLDLAARAGL